MALLLTISAAFVQGATFICQGRLFNGTNSLPLQSR